MDLDELVVRINIETGRLEPYTRKIVRRLSDMKDFYYDKEAVQRILAKEDPIIYEVYAWERSTDEGNLSFATTILNPGKIGDEYYMTKGHFHSKRDRAEVYITLSGNGKIVIQDEDGDASVLDLVPNSIIYVPPRHAHRTVNIGNKPLIFIAIYPSDAGHDYDVIAQKGFSKIIVERDGKPTAIDNPNYLK